MWLRHETFWASRLPNKPRRCRTNGKASQVRQVALLKRDQNWAQEQKKEPYGTPPDASTRLAKTLVEPPAAQTPWSVERRRTRGKDLKQRVRSMWVDAGVGAEAGLDWAHADMVRTSRALKVCTEAQACLSLRKVHLRLRRAQSATMARSFCNGQVFRHRSGR